MSGDMFSPTKAGARYLRVSGLENKVIEYVNTIKDCVAAS
jgi:hypothetical protein